MSLGGCGWVVQNRHTCRLTFPSALQKQKGRLMKKEGKLMNRGTIKISQVAVSSAILAFLLWAPFPSLRAQTK